MAAKALAASFPKRAWRRLTWREGSNTTLAGRFAAIQVRPAHRDYNRPISRPEEWLLVEWPDQGAAGRGGRQGREPRSYQASLAHQSATIRISSVDGGENPRINGAAQKVGTEFAASSSEPKGWTGGITVDAVSRRRRWPEASIYSVLAVQAHWLVRRRCHPSGSRHV